MKNFKDWLKLQEAGTGSGDVACLMLPIMMRRRDTLLGPWAEEDPFFKKKKDKIEKKNS